jgi:hypothetical protein
MTVLGLGSLANAQIGGPVDAEQQSDAKTLTPYGFFMPNIIAATKAVSSYGNNNESAMTEAAYPAVSASNSSPSGARDSIQVQQSRFGLKYNPSAQVRGQVEIDFLSTSNAAPTTGSSPRLRMAKVEYEAVKNLTVFLGQDWDLFSPLNPFGYNYVGNSFRAGNAGFFRQQLGVLTKPMEHLEAAASVGMGVPDSGITSDQADELSTKPVYQLRAAYVDGKNRAGLSGVYSQISYATVTNTSISPVQSKAMGLNAFAEGAMGNFELKAEAFMGQNLQNINMFTIGLANTNLKTVEETGGYISLKYHIQKASVWGTVGGDFMSHTAEISSAAAGTKGMLSNRAIKLGADYALTDKLKAFYEASLFDTKYFNANATTFANDIGFQLML